MKSIYDIPGLPARADDAHKSTVGRIMVVAGSMGEIGMAGAAVLTSNAALRSGAGLVCVATQRELMSTVSVTTPCATTMTISPGADIGELAVRWGADVVAIGPGLGDLITAEQMVHLMDRFSGGLVVDADALNALSRAGRWSAKWPHNVVLTPHPGEMKRLRDGWGLPVRGEKRGSNRGDDRERIAHEFAVETGAVVVLKGAHTVVADSNRVYVNQTGNSGMATGGAGDVLTGVIAALIGQQLSAFDAAVLGTHLHGLAGDFAAEELGRISLTATDLIDFLPDAFCDLEQHNSI